MVTPALIKSKKLWLLPILLIVVVAAFFVGLRLQNSGDTEHKLLLGGKPFSVDVVTTEAEKQQGLSGRPGLGQNEAMLFVYNETANRCLWMKDMRFTIDMIWLSADKQIIAIERSVSPESYPKIYCHDGQYLVETSSGIAESLGLQTGDQVDY